MSFKLNVNVRHERTTITMIVACGDGARSFKWLALVVSQRFALSAPNGSLRSREAKRALSTRVTLKPVNVCCASNAFLHPDAIVRDHVLDGDEIEVTLGAHLAVGTEGQPNPTPWAAIAFGGTSTRARHSDQRVQDSSTPFKRNSAGEDNLAVEAWEVELKRSANFMRQIMQSQLVDETRIAADAEADWMYVKDHLPPVDPDKLLAVKAVAAAHFMEIQALLHMYQGADGEVNFDEFETFVRESAIFKTFLDVARLRRLFSSCVRTSAEIGKVGTLNRPKFASALIQLAAIRYIETVDSEARGHLSKYVEPSRATDVSTPSLSLAFEVLVEAVLRPFLIGSGPDFSFKAFMASDRALAELRNYHDAMLAAFTNCHHRSLALSPRLPFLEVVQLLRKAHLVPGHDEESRAVKQAESYLALARGPYNLGRRLESEGKSDDSTGVSYSEFVEIVLRAGQEHQQNQGMSRIERLRYSMSMMIQT